MKKEIKEHKGSNHTQTFWYLEDSRDRVRLRLGRDNYLEVTVNEEGEGLEIRGYDGTLIVQPNVTNRIDVSLVSYEATMVEKEDLLNEIEELKQKLKAIDGTLP